MIWVKIVLAIVIHYKYTVIEPEENTMYIKMNTEKYLIKEDGIDAHGKTMYIVHPIGKSGKVLSRWQPAKHINEKGELKISTRWLSKLW